ncbi:DUF1566 domain-containing protein [bacterium]|nr:DUF1566 domain-containing protein [bacterium]
MMKWIAVGSVLLAGASLAQATPAQKCAAGKIAEAGSYAKCRAGAEKKRILTGDEARYQADLGKCVDKSSRHWASLEQGAVKRDGTCPSTGDASFILGVIDIDLGDLTRRLSGGPRLDDNGDGTITDNKTGLMWEKKIRDGSGASYAQPHNADNGYLWSGTCTISGHLCQPTAAAAAACAAGVEGDATGCAVCSSLVADGTCFVDPDASGETTIWQWLVDLNAANFAGHDDWRIPTITELQSIISYAATNPAVSAAFHGSSCGPACSDLTSPACSCTHVGIPFYFSATTTAADPTAVWYVSFLAGEVASMTKGNDVWVRAVRGGM